MIYCLYGTEKVLIDKFINDKINEYKIDNISKYNEDASIIEVINDALYLDLFSETKVVIYESKDLFNNKNEFENNTLENYLITPNEKTILFLIVPSESIDERKKFVKLLREKYKVLEFNKLKKNDVLSYIKNSFINDGYKINESSINLLIDYVKENTSLLYTDIEKLKIYKIKEKEILIDDIKKVIKKEKTTDVFKLVEAVLNNNKENMLSIYKDLIKSGEDEIKLIILLAGELRLLYQVKILSKEILNEKEIASKLSVHPFRVKLALNRCRNFSESKILDLILELQLLDENIKTGKIIKENALFNFFLGI
ncbi:MAG: DNA polymerase III subunit delta [Bacilli bacterium]|nr:DNA polymerase III subunit delta [Bacilli bacterium]